MLNTASDYTKDGLDTAVIDKNGELVWAGYDCRVSYGDSDVLCYNAGVHSGLLVVSDAKSGGSAVVDVETGEFVPLPDANLTLRDDFRDGLATVYNSSRYGVVDTQGSYVSL